MYVRVFFFLIVYLTESEVIPAVNVKMNGLMNHSVHSIDVLVTIQHLARTVASVALNQ